MTSLSKKFVAAFVSVLVTVCLMLGILYLLPESGMSVYAAEEQTADTITLSDEKYFDITVDGVLTGIKDYAGDVGTKNVEIIIPASVKEIGASNATGSLFLDISDKLVKVNLGSATKINVGAFRACRALSEIEIPASIEEIGDSAFASCTALKKITFASGSKLLTIGNSAFASCTGLNSVLELPSGLESIGQSAFSGCSSLLRTKLPDSLISIGSSAFKGCTSFTEITIPKNVETLGERAFEGCTSVKNINFYATECTSGKSVSPFVNGGSGVKVIIGGESTVKSIPSYLFTNTNVSEVELANVNLNVSGLGTNVFAGCKQLTKVTFSAQSRVLSLPSYTFDGCTSLYDITLPESLENIGANVFSNCPSLYKINIPSSVESIGENAFGGSTRIIEVKNLSTKITVKKDNTNGGIGLYAENVYDSTGSSKITDLNGFVFLNGSVKYLIKYTGSDSVLELPVDNYKIYNRAFYNNTDITEVTIPAGVTEIGTEAFSGCSSLVKIIIPSTVKEDASDSGIGESAFLNCTSLKIVELAANLTSIKSNTFAGCGSLAAVSVPKNVNAIYSSAFEGCSALKKVTFDENSALRTIEQDAFKDCASLKVFVTPAGVTGIGNSAFVGCNNLKTFYLPNALSSYNAACFPADRDLVLIAPDRTSYALYKENLKSLICKLTYEVEISLVYDLSETAEKHIVLKLFGLDSNYEKDNATLIWNISENGMPVQNGYKKSVWYKTENADGYSEEINKEALDGLLLDTVWTQDATLYAYVFSDPAVQVKSNLVYNEGHEFLAEDIFENWDGTLYSIEIRNYLTSTGSGVTNLPEKITEAGTYTLFIKLLNENLYGQWDINEARTATVVIGRANLSGNNDAWMLEDGTKLLPDDINDLEGKTLYIYGTIPYLTMKDSGEYKEVKVLSSYIQRTGKSYTLKYGEAQNNEYQIIGYSGEYTGKEAKIYSATVNLRMNNNYQLQVVESDAKLRGLEVIQSGDICSITKTWYIVNVSGGTLVSDKGLFAFPENVTYGQESDFPAAPSYAPDSESEPADFYVTFNLDKIDEETESQIESIISDYELTKANFGYYINSSMPAGNYLFTVNVFAKGSNDKERIEYFEYGFTVNKAELGSLTSLIFDKEEQDKSIFGNLMTGGNVVCEIANDGKIHVDDGYLNAVNGKISVPVLTLTKQQIHNRKGVWVNPVYDVYYTKVEMTYRIECNGVDGMYFYNASELAETTVVPNKPGKYLIHYNFVAPNYEPFVDETNSSEVKSYYYTLIIYEEIALPSVDREEYTGNVISFNVASPYYTAILLDGKSAESRTAMAAVGVTEPYNYIDEGEHVIALRFNTTDKSYRWKGVQSYQDGRYARLPVVINRAKNVTVQPLYLKGWEWGSFNPENNRPVWGTKFSEGLTYTYTLTNKETGDVYVYNSEKEGEGFNCAVAGTYDLLAVCEGNKNIEKLELKIPVEILKADITWEAVPHINSWRYGDYSKIFEEPNGVINPIYSEVVDEIEVYYCLQNELENANRKKYISLSELLDANGEIPSGNYVLVYELASSVNYNEWSYPVYFSVLKAENYWDVTPSVQGWRYGEFAERGKDPVAAPHFKGVVTFAYERLDADGVPMSAKYGKLSDMVAKEGAGTNELPVGNYRLTVAVTGTVDYESMKKTEVLFSVSKTDNSWVEIPTVIGWSEGNYKAESNCPQAKSKFGSVRFMIKDADGNEYDIGKIKSLGVGAYTLIATVDGTDNYNELVATATFAVFEDSVGMTGLAVATTVFAVIAIGLAVCGAVLLIRRNKKIEEEFRSMIKSELNRR